MKQRMKESYRENLASSSGHKPYAGSGDAPGVARVRGDAGEPLSSEINVPVGLLTRGRHFNRENREWER